MEKKLDKKYKLTDEAIKDFGNIKAGEKAKLLKSDLVYKWTKEELEDYMKKEYMKCMEDPAYFATKCYIITPTGLQKVVLRDYQVE